MAKKPARTPTRRKPASAKRSPDPDVESVYALVRAIPRGRVVTYGQVAEMIGRPAGHRFVAKVMRHCPSQLPWQRVVGRRDARRAQINIQDPEHATRQRSLLAAEGVTFDANGFIVLAKSGWR